MWFFKQLLACIQRVFAAFGLHQSFDCIKRMANDKTGCTCTDTYIFHTHKQINVTKKNGTPKFQEVQTQKSENFSQKNLHIIGIFGNFWIWVSQHVPNPKFFLGANICL